MCESEYSVVSFEVSLTRFPLVVSLKVVLVPTVNVTEDLPEQSVYTVWLELGLIDAEPATEVTDVIMQTDKSILKANTSDNVL